MSAERKRRILVVEDDPEMQYLLSVILEADDREIAVAGSGEEAERELASGPVDLVVLDLILPDVDGRTVLTRIRERPATAAVPVVVISARGGAEIRQDSYSLGADYFAEKPFDPDEVAADISARLERSAGRDYVDFRDPATDLLNRAGLLKAYRAEEGPRGLALIELDGFLSITERWGWEVAENVLRRVGEAIDAHTSEASTVGRLGGGEFVTLEQAADHDRMTREAEAVLDSIRALPMEDPDGETFRLTASIGVVAVGGDLEFEEALEAARGRLFRARQSGRNCVVASDEDADEAGATRVLVAEDDEISATILLHRLRKEGLEVIRYDNGREAYEGALEETPDLVILDIKMPGMDGFEVLERLRRTPSYARVPIILLTSMGSEADVVRGFQLGADDYILKPFSPIELSARVWRLLRRGRSETAI